MKFSFFTSIALLIFLSSCKEEKAETEMAVDDEIEVQEEVGVKMYVLDGGTVQVNDLSVFSQGDRYKDMSREFADAMYIIEHPDGLMLWDAGLSEGLVGQEPFTTPNGVFTISRKDSIVNQLAKLNLSPDDFKYLALSHTHFDHSGSASKFKSATWLVQETEYQFVTSEEIQNNQPDMYNAIKDLSNIKRISGDYDVFGDGKVLIKSLPGHTPGHQALYVELDDAGPVLLTGDLYHIEENRNDKVVPSFNVDAEQTLSSMEKFEAFAKEKGARVIIQHSKADFESLPKFPEALD